MPSASTLPDHGSLPGLVTPEGAKSSVVLLSWAAVLRELTLGNGNTEPGLRISGLLSPRTPWQLSLTLGVRAALQPRLVPWRRTVERWVLASALSVGQPWLCALVGTSSLGRRSPDSRVHRC